MSLLDSFFIWTDGWIASRPVPLPPRRQNGKTVKERRWRVRYCRPSGRQTKPETEKGCPATCLLIATRWCEDELTGDIFPRSPESSFFRRGKEIGSWIMKARTWLLCTRQIAMPPHPWNTSKEREVNSDKDSATCEIENDEPEE